MPMTGSASAVKPQQHNSNEEFLGKWQYSIRPRLTQLLAHLGGQEVAKSLAIAQIITYLPVLTEGRQCLKADVVCLLGNPLLQDFHVACCQQGLQLTHLGPMGKVWESGVVQVVQHAGNLPTDRHPLNLLSPPLAESVVDEIVYLPLYDAAPGSSIQGVIAVLELMVSPGSSDPMVVANLISTVSHIMGSVGLALSNPAQADVLHRESPEKLLGKKGAPLVSSSFDANNRAWSASASARSIDSAGGGLARTASIRTMAGLSAMIE